MTTKRLVITVLGLIYCLAPVKCARILGVFHFASTSHYILGHSLMKGLASAGHDVTMISPYEDNIPPSNGSYRNIVLTGFVDEFEEMRKGFNLFNTSQQSILAPLSMITHMFAVVDNTFTHPNVKALLDSNEKFDVVIIEQFANDAMKIFANHFNAPLIILSSMGPNTFVNRIAGNPSPPSYVPHIMSNLSPNMSFFERVINLITYVFDHLFDSLLIFPRSRESVSKHFPNSPDLRDIYHDASIILLNSHESLNLAVPLVPNLIQIGGYHVKPPKKLPKDLQEYLDNAKEGVVYFSLGSNLKSKELPPERRDIFLKAFSKLQVKVLWKWEDDVLPGQPPNVKLGKWLPQQDILEKFDGPAQFQGRFSSPLFLFLVMNGGTINIAEKTLGHPKVQDLIHSGEKFDVVIVVQFFNDAMKALATHFNSHLVIFSNSGPTSLLNPLIGNPVLPSHFPELMMDYPVRMTYFQRVLNAGFKFLITLNLHWLYFPKQNSLIQKYIPNPVDINDVLYNASLVLLNSHTSFTDAQPAVPTMVDIGGFHIKPAKKLPNDLQKFMDDAKEGVIYFSLGSNLKSKNLPVNKREAILKAFGKRKEKVLWKWEDDVLPGQPPNVMLGKWLPQQDILAHPNTKVFITHGGMLSTIEAVYRGVPIVAIPIFGDQFMNAKTAEDSGYGIVLPFGDLSEDTLSSVLDQIISNPKYQDNVKERSRIMQDRQVKPLDNAIYWIEYIIRHNGAKHLRVSYLELAWYQYYLLDVLAFYLLLIVVICIVIKKSCSYVCRRRTNKRKVKTN